LEVGWTCRTHLRRESGLPYTLVRRRERSGGVEGRISSLIVLLDRMSQVKKEMLKPRGPKDFENAASVVEEETEKVIRG
jgi:hypothetical protein